MSSFKLVYRTAKTSPRPFRMLSNATETLPKGSDEEPYQSQGSIASRAPAIPKPLHELVFVRDTSMRGIVCMPVFPGTTDVTFAVRVSSCAGHIKLNYVAALTSASFAQFNVISKSAESRNPNNGSVRVVGEPRPWVRLSTLSSTFEETENRHYFDGRAFGQLAGGRCERHASPSDIDPQALGPCQGGRVPKT